MKKRLLGLPGSFYVLCIAVVLTIMVFALLAAKPQKKGPSWYDNRTFTNAKILEGEWLYMDEDMFSDKREGFVRLNGDVFSPTWTGLVKVSGACNLKLDAALFIILLETDKKSYRLVTGDDIAGSFSTTIPAEPMKIQVFQNSTHGANGLRCNLLFQAVE